VHAYQFVKDPSKPHATPYFQPLFPTPQQLQYDVDGNGQGTQFSVVFSRVIFSNPSSPAPSPSPLATNWTYNAFATQANVQGQLVFVDSMGAGGPVAPQYVLPVLDSAQRFDRTFYALSGGLRIDPPAQILELDISNNLERQSVLTQSGGGGDQWAPAQRAQNQLVAPACSRGTMCSRFPRLPQLAHANV
jgi:hypothetical protein